MLLERSDLSPAALQVALYPCQLGLRSPIPMVAIVVGALHKRLKLAPQESQPWVPVYATYSILELTGVNRSLDLLLGQSELPAGRLVAQRCTLPAPILFHGRAASSPHRLGLQRNALPTDVRFVDVSPGVRVT